MWAGVHLQQRWLSMPRLSGGDCGVPSRTPKEREGQAPQGLDPRYRGDSMTERELGSETIPCPTCGAPLPIVEMGEDGSATHTLCTNCYQPEQAAAPAPRTPRETGTNVTPEVTNG